jgi:hypothetical protein
VCLPSRVKGDDAHDDRIFQQVLGLRRHPLSILINVFLDLLHVWTSRRLIPPQALAPAALANGAVVLSPSEDNNDETNVDAPLQRCLARNRLCMRVMVDVIIIIVTETMIHMLRLSSLFHNSLVLMMLKLT